MQDSILTTQPNPHEKHSHPYTYIPDYSFVQGDFSIWLSSWWYDPCPVGIENIENEPESLLIYPNPVTDIAKVSLNLKQCANVMV